MSNTSTVLILVLTTVLLSHVRAQCPSGFVTDESTGTCVDVDECLIPNGPDSPLGPFKSPSGHDIAGFGNCDRRTECYNTVGSRKCGECPKDNYVGDGESGCQDVDECLQPGEPKCHEYTKCENTDGGYTCTKCPEGFAGSGRQGCVNVNECDLAVAACSPMVSCSDLVPTCPLDAETGLYFRERPSQESDLPAWYQEVVRCSRGFECGKCPFGYQGDGIGRDGCVDVNECDESNWKSSLIVDHGLVENYIDGTNPCGVQPCKNRPGTYECIGFAACDPGYWRNPATGQCEDINECLGPGCRYPEDKGCPEVEADRGAVNGGCPAGRECINTVPFSTCSDCPSGYQQDPATDLCVDINECLVNNGGCEREAQCFNTNGTGGISTPRTDPSASITGRNGSYPGCGEIIVGPCPTGYRRPNQNSPCIDIDECEQNPCHFRTRCVNTPGRFYCTDCPAGFIGTGLTQCEDIDECKDVILDNGDCDPLTLCTNQVPNRTCGPCPPGYTGNGYDGCIDINECKGEGPAYQNNEGVVKAYILAQGRVLERPIEARFQRWAPAPYGGCANATWCINRPGTWNCGECPNPPPVCRKCDEGRTSEGRSSETFTSDVVDWLDDGCEERIDEKTGEIAWMKCTPVPPVMRMATVDGRQTCVDIDECKLGAWNGVEGHKCHYRSSCKNLQSQQLRNGSWTNGYDCLGCQTGFTGGGWNNDKADGRLKGLDTKSTSDEGCNDINECEIYCTEKVNSSYFRKCSGPVKERCGETPCINTEGDFTCDDRIECPYGQKQTGEGVYKRCVDINECLEGITDTGRTPRCKIGNLTCDPENGGCDLNVQCNNLVFPGLRSCSPCPPGYTGDGEPFKWNKGIGGWLSDPAGTCRDINECEVNNGGCDPLQVCVNQVPHFRCEECADGYRKDPVIGCRDIDECGEGMDNCNDLAPCVNLNGTFACRGCQEGFRFRSGTVQIDGLILGTQVCEGGICQDGCEDVDECKEGKDECSAEPIRQADGSIVASERCVNTIGSYVCIAWNATTCTGPTAVADTDTPEVKGILGLNGRVPLFGDKSTPGSSPIKSYYWTLVRAPDGAQPRLTSVTSPTAQASQLSKQGEYVFEVVVTDNCGEVGRATVRVNKLLDEKTIQVVTPPGLEPNTGPGTPRPTSSPGLEPGPGGVTTIAPVAARPWTKARTNSPTELQLNSGERHQQVLLLLVAAVLVVLQLHLC